MRRIGFLILAATALLDAGCRSTKIREYWVAEEEVLRQTRSSERHADEEAERLRYLRQLYLGEKVEADQPPLVLPDNLGDL
ncbi:MAG: hypothetical protein QGG36_24830 [Pirellulaceae bacterium]|jgi:hypothetical protein|nr:hypothetical protein [Pirellulaceae bacterium]MDP7019045.1 hypothetical protein [Pirellulaceae bacterium]